MKTGFSTALLCFCEKLQFYNLLQLHFKGCLFSNIIIHQNLILILREKFNIYWSQQTLWRSCKERKSKRFLPCHSKIYTLCICKCTSSDCNILVTKIARDIKNSFLQKVLSFIKQTSLAINLIICMLLETKQEKVAIHFLF